MIRPLREGTWHVTWRRFRRSTLATIALVYVAVVAAIALLAPLLASARPVAVHDGRGWHFPAVSDLLRGEIDRPYVVSPGATYVLHAPVPFSPNGPDLAHRLTPPDALHRLGTDPLGRDVLARTLHGARVSLAVALTATAISLLVGAFFGALAGYYGGAVDWIVSRAIEVVLCFPFLFLVLAIVAFFHPSLATIIVALGFTSWTTEARYMRGELLRIRDAEFAQAARASGARDVRIIFRHLVPNAIAPVLVSSSFNVAAAILTESALSFLGLGVQLPMASWGSMLAIAEEYIDSGGWWLSAGPGTAIFVTVAAFNIIGDRFRDALDPRIES